jgi:hypothetical protein
MRTDHQRQKTPTDGRKRQTNLRLCKVQFIRRLQTEHVLGGSKTGGSPHLTTGRMSLYTKTKVGRMWSTGAYLGGLKKILICPLSVNSVSVAGITYSVDCLDNFAL